MSNLKQLAMAMLLYSEDYDGQLPPDSQWRDAIRPRKNATFGKLRCRLAKWQPWTYAMNRFLSGAKAQVSEPDAIVLLFDSVPGEKNAAAGPEKLAFRHGGRTTVAFLSGHAKAMTKEKALSLNWKHY